MLIGIPILLLHRFHVSSISSQVFWLPHRENFVHTLTYEGQCHDCMEIFCHQDKVTTPKIYYQSLLGIGFFAQKLEFSNSKFTQVTQNLKASIKFGESQYLD